MSNKQQTPEKELAEQLLLASEEMENRICEILDEHLVIRDMARKVLSVVTHRFLNTPITIEGGVCPECQGKGGWDTRQDDPEPPTMCLDCGGAGKLPDKTFTLAELLKEKMR